MKNRMKRGNNYGIALPMPVTPLMFRSDGYRLQGFLHQPETPSPAVVIGSHGLYSSAASGKQVALAEVCAARNIAFFRFDHRGCGQSEGRFETVTNLPARCKDMVSAVDALKKAGVSCERLGLFGSSMGGAVCLSVAQALSARAMVLNAAPVVSGPVLEALGVTNAAISSPRHLPLRFDLSDYLDAVHHLLIFHGDADRVVPPGNARLIHSRAGHPKKCILFKGGDHAMSRSEDQRRFVREALSWFERYLMGVPSG